MHTLNGEAVVLAPPNVTTSMYYYGRVRGLATLGWEDREGLGAAVRIASASSPEEAQQLISRRGITHIIIPQWDSYLDVYARMGLGQLDGSFIQHLHRWDLPGWLRAVPYTLPKIPGFESQSVIILEVVEDQGNAVAAGRLAEYFVETDQLDLAASAVKVLRRYPSDLGALIARAQVEKAVADNEGFAHTLELLLPRASIEATRSLQWDRRVSLAVVLALGQKMSLAQTQVTQCLAEIDERKLRALSTMSLYHLRVLAKIGGQEIADPGLRELSSELLPDFLRTRLQQ